MRDHDDDLTVTLASSEAWPDGGLDHAPVPARYRAPGPNRFPGNRFRVPDPATLNEPVPGEAPGAGARFWRVFGAGFVGAVGGLAVIERAAGMDPVPALAVGAGWVALAAGSVAMGWAANAGGGQCD